MGYSRISTLLAEAANYNLTDLATAKTELGLKTVDTSQDNWLTTIAIPQVSSSVQEHCERPFVPVQVQDAFDIEQDAYPYQTPGGFRVLQLSVWPVLGVISVVQTVALNTTQILTLGKDYRLNARDGQLERLNPFTGVVTAWEALPVMVIYTAGFGALASEAHTVPANPGPYTVTVSSAATFSTDHQVTYSVAAPLVRVSGVPAQGQYSVAAGVYTFAAGDAGQALTIAYATTAIKPGLVDQVLRLISARYYAKGRDPTLVQKDQPGVGSQRFWFGGAPGQKGEFAPDIEAALNKYRVPTVA